VLVPCFDRFTPGKDLITCYVEGWVRFGASLNGTEILAVTGIRSPDRPARRVVAIPTLSQKMYRYHHEVLGARKVPHRGHANIGFTVQNSRPGVQYLHICNNYIGLIVNYKTLYIHICMYVF
jgi:hypothetical protein